jgi:hypothetical protein
MQYLTSDRELLMSFSKNGFPKEDRLVRYILKYLLYISVRESLGLRRREIDEKKTTSSRKSSREILVHSHISQLNALLQ